VSDCIHHLSISHSPVFLLNSCLDLFSAPHLREDPLFRSYGANLPSSLTVNLPSALVYSTRLRVSVCGTGALYVECLADFLGSMLTSAITLPEGFVYCQVRLRRRICLPSSTPTPFNAVFRHRARVSLLRLRVAIQGSNGILTVSAIGLAFRLILRSRLTPGRLTLPGKP
jgi:hypothetical protein